VVIDAHLHLWNTGRLRFVRRGIPFDQLPPAGREAVLGGTATRSYALGTPAGDASRPGRQ
jgi:hypothetical protein